MGRLIVIEGLDGSGKATQAKLLTEALHKNGKQVKQVSFPDYNSPSSTLVKMYLAGEFGTKPDDVNAYAASAFYAVDRYASFKKDWQDIYRTGIVVADRYTTSNAVHQCSKLDPSEWESFLAWLEVFEYGKLRIPAPDLVIYLRVDPDVSQKLLAKRYEGHMEKEDIHEKDREYLNRCRSAAEFCADKLNWKTVECTKNGEMKTIEEIHNEVMRIVGDIL